MQVSTGIMYQLPTVTAADNAATIRNNAIAYMRYKDSFASLHPAIIEELHDYVNRTFANLPCTVSFKPADVPCDVMTQTFKQSGILVISSLNNNSRLFPGGLNLKFRAIHDYIHATQPAATCDFVGEYRAYSEQSKGLSYGAKQVLYSEIVLQACFFLYFGYFPDNQKIVLVTLA